MDNNILLKKTGENGVLFLPCLPTQKARREVIKEIHRVLKPGGKIALLDFQYVKEYKESLLNLGWKNIICSRRMFNMFPPVIIIMASKPTELV